MIENAMKYRLFSKPFNILTISNNFELKNNNIIKKLKSFYMALIYCLGTNNKQNNLAKKRYQCALLIVTINSDLIFCNENF